MRVFVFPPLIPLPLIQWCCVDWGACLLSSSLSLPTASPSVPRRHISPLSGRVCKYTCRGLVALGAAETGRPPVSGGGRGEGGPGRCKGRRASSGPGRGGGRPGALTYTDGRRAQTARSDARRPHGPRPSSPHR